MTSRLSILHIGKFYPPDRGGIEAHLETLCRHHKDDFDLRVFVANRSRLTTDELIEGVPVTRFGTKLHVAGASVTPALFTRLRDAKVDLIHFHAPNPPAAIAYLVSGASAPLVISWHSDIVRQRVLGAAFSPLMQWMLRRARAVIVGSRNYLETSRDLTSHRDRAQVIPYGIDVADFDRVHQASVAAIRKRHGSPLVLAVGRLTRYKGFEYLIAAMRGVAATLVVIGDGSERDALERVAASAGVADRVTFVGDVDDLAPWYQACDLFVLPSVERNESFGIVQAEAMACRKPVVNTQLTSGVPFVSQDGETGITVPPRNADALGHAINTLLSSPALAARYGAAGRHRVETLFDARDMSSKIAALYRAIVH